MKSKLTHLLVALAAIGLTLSLQFLAGVRDAKEAVASEASGQTVERSVQEGVREGMKQGSREAVDEVLSLEYLDRKIERELASIERLPVDAGIRAASQAASETVELLGRVEALLGTERVLEILRLLLGERAGELPAGEGVGPSDRPTRGPDLPLALGEEAFGILSRILETPVRQESPGPLEADR